MCYLCATRFPSASGGSWRCQTVHSAGYTDTGQVLGVDLHVKTLGLCVP